MLGYETFTDFIMTLAAVGGFLQIMLGGMTYAVHANYGVIVVSCGFTTLAIVSQLRPHLISDGGWLLSFAVTMLVVQFAPSCCRATLKFVRASLQRIRTTGKQEN